MAKEDTPIFSQATPGDIIRSEDWNLIQRELRFALRHHKHSINGNIDDADGTQDNAAQLTAEELQDQVVTTDKLADGCVTAEKIAPDVVIGVEDNAVTEEKIADGAVTRNKIANDAIIMSKIDSSVVTSIRNNIISALPAATSWRKIKVDEEFSQKAEILEPLVLGTDPIGRRHLQGVFRIATEALKETLNIGTLEEEGIPKYTVAMPIIGLGMEIGVRAQSLIHAAVIITTKGEVSLTMVGKEAELSGTTTFNLNPLQYWAA